ncbi:MAG TPA: hypothetical protein VFX84_01075 [Candidatus Saccharimonadales bacterium]|nr:hypothetical protein [Candidatus Saccharimonadales bacterium]
MKELVKIVVTVPEADADKVRQAIGDAGGGALGNYTHASFSVKGVGRFLPGEGAKPAVGKVGELEEVVEERIEVTCERSKKDAVVSAIRKNHPYEEPVIDVYPLV